MATAQHLTRLPATDWTSVERMRRGRERLISGPAGPSTDGSGSSATGAEAGAVGVSDAAHLAAGRLVTEPKASALEAGEQWQVRGVAWVERMSGSGEAQLGSSSGGGRNRSSLSCDGMHEAQLMCRRQSR